MKKGIQIILSLLFFVNLTYGQEFQKHISFAKFDNYAQSLNGLGFVYLFAESKGDSTKGTRSYSAMLANGKGSIDLKLMKIDEFVLGTDIIADINTGIYTKYDHRLIFWSLTKSKQGFIYIELPEIDALLILGMQPENTQEILEQTMLKIGCLEFFKALE